MFQKSIDTSWINRENSKDHSIFARNMDNDFIKNIQDDPDDAGNGSEIKGSVHEESGHSPINNFHEWLIILH